MMSARLHERLVDRFREMLFIRFGEMLCKRLGETLDLNFMQALGMIQEGLNLSQIPCPDDGLGYID